MEGALILVLLLMSSFVPAVVIFFLNPGNETVRNVFNIAGVSFKIFFVTLLFLGLISGKSFVLEYKFFQGVTFILKADGLALLFVSLSSVLWLFTTLYAIAYFKNQPNKNRFFGFFHLCVTATVGLALAGNLFSFFLFYEFLTLATFPLILHERTRAAKEAALTYLKYTITGGALLLVGIAMIYTYAGCHGFESGGYLSAESPIYLAAAFVFLLLGVGVKAALFGLHAWLPKAMAAPAPVSALLHAVAVVKAGAFGIIRIIYEVYGIKLSEQLGLLDMLAAVAAVTIIYGSIKALMQSDIKKRLAYSTVSQVSYIALGVSIFGPLGSIGGMVHLVHQGVMKITLFFGAGSMAKTYGITRIDDLDGLAKTMPLTALSFSIAALGMIGLPPLAGFVTKWYLGLGALQNAQWCLLGVILVSALLNAMYFLPMIYRIYFLPPKTEEKKIEPTRFETRLFLLLPPLFTALATVGLGVFALHELSALSYVKTIIAREYGQ